MFKNKKLVNRFKNFTIYKKNTKTNLSIYIETKSKMTYSNTLGESPGESADNRKLFLKQQTQI